MTTSKVLVTAGSKVYSSTNGGQSFAEVISTTLQASTQGLNSIYLDEEGYGYVVGDNGTAFRIEPSSTTYTKVATDVTPTDDKGTGIPQVNLAQVQFTDRYTGYISADGGLLLKTIDGGAHWKQEQTGTTTGVPILAMSVDRSTGTLIAGNSVQQLKDESQKFNSRFWYDELGRLVLSQNAKQFKTNANGQKAYSYTLYDPIGRITEVGELLTTAPVTTRSNDFQVAYAAHTNFVTTGTRHQVTRTKYDNNDNKPEGFEPRYLRNRVAYTTYKQEEDAPQQETHYSYDVHGNVKQLMQVIRSTSEQLTKTVDYEYDLVSGKVNKVYYQKAQADQFIHTYNYDGDNRITKVETSTDDVIYTQEATYQYYAHGPLARTKLGEDGRVETQDYAYTIQGWIKQVQGDAFGYALGYNGTDYSPIGTSTNNNLTTPIETGKDLYNGNIATMTSKTKGIDGGNPWTQQFTYDQLNRIKTSATPGSSQYATAYSYDANGNILSLSRKDDAGNTFDELSYIYETKANGYQKNTNKLRSVNDAVANSSHTADIEDQSNDNYSYDAIGNLISDRSEEIENIEWSVSGKVLSVTRTQASTKANLTFDYDASGQRIAKHVHEDDGTVKSTYYVRDASGNVMSVYRATNTQTASVKEQYIYGSSRIGVYNAGENNSSNSHTLGLRHYELTDHLGNVRVVLSDYKQDVISATDYYPFGMEIEGRRVLGNEKYRMNFNGKELDEETGWQDYGFRMYNPKYIRFFSVDPITSEYPMLTPFQFASNRPIDGIDLDGLEFDWAGDLWEATKSGYNTTVKTVNNTYVSTTKIVNSTYNQTVKSVTNVYNTASKTVSSTYNQTVKTTTQVYNATVNKINSTIKQGVEAYNNTKLTLSIDAKVTAGAQAGIDVQLPGIQKTGLYLNGASATVVGYNSVEQINDVNRDGVNYLGKDDQIEMNQAVSGGVPIFGGSIEQSFNVSIYDSESTSNEKTKQTLGVGVGGPVNGLYGERETSTGTTNYFVGGNVGFNAALIIGVSLDINFGLSTKDASEDQSLKPSETTSGL